MSVTDEDREAVNSYLRGQMRRAFQGDTDLHKQYLTEAFARHRIEARRKALEDALVAVREALPYGTCLEAIRAMIEGEGLKP